MIVFSRFQYTELDMILFFYRIESLGMNYLGRKTLTALWYLLKYLLNLILPIYYKITHIPPQQTTRTYVNGEVIISMTTFPARMRRLPIVLESLYRQTVRADRLILWLADNQYENKEQVTRDLEKFINQGLEIIYCDDLRSHKKYYYAMKDNPDAFIVTVDDDILYSENMLERLLLTYKNNPDCICAHRGHKMKFDANNQLLSYNNWNHRAKGCLGPDFYLCQTGGAGCLYPPNSLDDRAFDIENIKELCPMADDLWLKAMSFLKGTKVVLTGIDNPEIIDVIGNKSNGLAKENVENNLNDKQLKAVTDYFHINWQKYL